MTRLRRPSTPALLALLTAAGVAAVLAGLYLMLGLAPALIVGGAVATALGLLVDV